MKIIDIIPVGKANAVTRIELVSITGLTDRKIRSAISYARRNTPILYDSEKGGYFLPDIKDIAEVDHFISIETSRAKSIFWSMAGAREWQKKHKVVK